MSTISTTVDKKIDMYFDSLKCTRHVNEVGGGVAMAANVAHINGVDKSLVHQRDLPKSNIKSSHEPPVSISYLPVGVSFEPVSA